MEAIVRLIQPEDHPALLRVLREVHLRDGYPTLWPERPLDFLRPPDTVAGWVLDLHGEACGQVLLRELADPLPGWLSATRIPGHELLVISRFFLGPAARGQGHGERLFRVAWEEVRASGKRAVLDVHVRNVAATRLYEKLGWQRVATMQGNWRDPDGHCAVVHVYVAPEA